MNSAYRLDITIPSQTYPLVEYRRDFAVQGKLEGAIFDGMILTVELFDDGGKLVRKVTNNKKNDERIYLDHPALTTYKEELDPGKEKLKAFGFPELLVKDLDDPLTSLADASIKCFYKDDSFKAIIVSGSDVTHGRIRESGMDYHDENGQPYESLKEGDYLLRVSLCDRDGNVLADDEKRIKIAIRKEAAIVRFNPVAHRQRMNEWCKENNFTIINDPLPGYLDPYLGKWYYHMGLLPYYRSNDLAVYAQAQVHMFVYLCDPHSTSYETELAYLQLEKRVGDDRWFKAYHYDIGEAILGKGKGFERQGKILEFGKDEVLYLCRIDEVNEKAKENYFDLSEEGLIGSYYENRNIKVKVNSKIGIMGVVKPQQLDPEDLCFTAENICVFHNEINRIRYEIDDGLSVRCEERRLLMERYDEEPIGSSVYEFYHIFAFDEKDKGKIFIFKAKVLDRNDKEYGVTQEFKIEVE